MVCGLPGMLKAQTVCALCMFGVGLPACLITDVWTVNHLRWLVKDGQKENCTTKYVHEIGQQATVCTMENETQLTDMDISFGNPAPGDTVLAYTLHGAMLSPGGWYVNKFAECFGDIASVTFVFVLVVMIFGVVQVTRLHRRRSALCGEPGVWASRVLLWISSLLVQIMFFVQVLVVAVFLLLDCLLCPPGVGSFAVDVEGYCDSSKLRGGMKTTCEMAAWIVLGYFLLQYALILTASALNAELAVARGPKDGMPLLG